MRTGLALLVGRSKTNGSANFDEGGLIGRLLRLIDGRAEVVEAVGHVVHRQYLPAVRLVPHFHVLGKRKVCISIDGDVIIIIQDDEVAQPQVTGKTAYLSGDALLETSIATDDEGLAVDD